MDLKAYLEKMVYRNASDLYFKAGSPACFRIDDTIVPVAAEKLTTFDVDEVVNTILTDKQKTDFYANNEFDGAYSVSGLGRFRFNIYMQRNTAAVTLRSLKMDVPSFAELNLPVELMQRLSSLHRGLILITGYAGSGKSTTLASMIDHINQNVQKNIITIEDPIEFIHSDKKSIISQREVGVDTKSFGNALRHIIRQSPDIILIGEIRDVETMQIAIMAAETGHLVLSTLHTVDAVQTVERIINFFPAPAHAQVRMQLSLLLKGVVSMRLIPRSDKPGRIPACEVMLATPTVRKLIMEGKTNQLSTAIESGEHYGMQSFNQSLRKWLKDSVITKESALAFASNADELELQLKEILPGGGV